MARNAVPKHYRLEFQPDLDSGRVGVREGIDLDVRRPTRTIELHGVDLDVRRVAASSQAKRLEGRVRPGPRGQTLLFEFPERLPPGRTRLDLSFFAKMRSSLSGIYLARRRADRFVATQFEATDARAAFVCLDEPDAKATFSISAVVPEGWLAVSNGRVRAVAKRPKGLVRHTFAPTRRLPTYLVALCAGPWEASEERDVRGVPVRVLAPRGRGRLARTALDIACAAQAALEDYFGIPYPFGKCDHVAVPDFAAGAMENAACITYRETLLLVDPATVSIQERRAIAGVITHELAHQWFGNLVTPVWWSDLWLNESFATWITERILDGLHPDWQVWTAWEQWKSEALKLDALATTHPIRSRAQTVEEITQSFDAITYEKGACVLRMIESYLGPEVMRAGIRTYLARHADSNARAEDLWRALDETSGKPVSRILEGWITRPGFPVVRCERRGERVGLSQERFFADPARRASPRERWQVPVVVRAPDVETPLVLEGRSARLAIPRHTPWLTANGRSGGYYRVAYDGRSRRRLIEAFPALQPAERAGLLGDLWALARAGRGRIEDVLDVLDRLDDEPNHVVLGRGLACLKSLGDGIVPERETAALRRWVAKIFRPHHRKLGWEALRSEPEGDRLRRAVVLDALGDVARSAKVRAEAAEVADRFLAGPRAFDPDLLATVLRIAARSGGERLFERLGEKRRRAPTPQLERTYLFALCDFEDPGLQLRVLEETLAESIRSQDVALVMARLLGNRRARFQTWRFIRDRFEEINARAVWFMWKRIVEELPALGTREAHREIRAFFERNKLPDTAETIAQTLESMRIDLAFRRRARPCVAAWLESRGHGRPAHMR